MALPNLGQVFTPFDPLPASDLNDIVENVEALAAGTGLNDASVTAEKLAAAVTDMLDFSTSEKATGFLWVDGKVIYKRTFTGTISQAAATRNTVTLIASGIDKVLKYEGYYDEGGGLIVTLGSQRMATDGTVNGSDTVLNNGGAVAFLTKSAATRTNAPYAVTVFYTK